METTNLTPITELAERIQGSSNLCGTASGLEDAADMLLAKSGEYFVARKDTEATLCRVLSDLIRAEYRRKRKAYDDHAASVSFNAFRQLEEWAKLIKPEDEN